MEFIGHISPFCRCSGSSSDERKKRVVIISKRGELLYELRQLGYVEGDVLVTADDHDRHQVQDICEDGNVDRVTRVLDRAHGECVELLYPYSKVEVEDGTEVTDRLEEQDVYEIPMLVPSDVAGNTITLLQRYVHEYMVCSVMTDWMSIVNIQNPKSSQNWAMKLEEVKSNIESLMSTRMAPVRRRLDPF